jgi:hypothetical protein
MVYKLNQKHLNNLLKKNLMNKNIPFRFGSEVYTWFMSGDGETHKGQLGHMIDIIAKAGLFLLGWETWLIQNC